VNLRILKKLSKRAAPLLAALDDPRRGGSKHFVSDANDPGNASTGGHDRKHWERSHAVHGDAFGDAIAMRVRNPGSARYPFIHVRPPYNVWPGTPMVGWTSGYEEPEWEEHDAWAHLCDIVFWATHDVAWGDEGEADVVPLERCRNPRDILMKARSLVAEKQRSGATHG
jgi:hypothetical protein